MTPTINLRAVGIGVMICSGMIGAVQVAGPQNLGISQVAVNWLGIIAAGLAIAQGFLPRVQGPTTDPEALAERVWALPPDDREAVGHILAERAEGQRRVQAIRQQPAPIDPTTTAGRAAMDSFERRS